MATTFAPEPPLAHEATAPPTRAPARLWPALGLALGTTSAALALVLGVLALTRPEAPACDGACASLLSDPRWSRVGGLPVLAWSSALHAVVLAALLLRAFAPRRAASVLPPLALNLVLATLLLGTAAYLVLGLAVAGVACPLCLTLHGLALGASLGLVLSAPAHAEPTSRVLALIAPLIGLAAALLVAFGLGELARRAERRHAINESWLATVCAPTGCPAPATFDRSDLPEAASRLTLAEARPEAPILLALLDLGCAACRRDFAALEPLLSDLVATRRAGLELVLGVRSRACDPAATGPDDLSLCEAPAAVLCAARHGGGPSALGQLRWELGVAPGYHTLADRRARLAREVDPEAARCLDEELRLGTHGALAAHGAAARSLEARAASDPSCAPTTGDPPWWCFSTTPSFGVFTADAPSPGAALGLGAATGALRRDVLERCLEPTP